MSEPLRVLIVEDSENDELLVLRALRGQGFEPAHTRVQDPDALARALAQGPWDVVLSDFAMPQFTGADALRIMQERGLDLPFIVISGTVGEEVAVQTMRAGAHDYLMKDQLGRLGAAVRREIAAARARRERRHARDKLRHVNQVLRAIRNVNQLIVRENDPGTLIRQACETLIETRGYPGAWIAVGDPDSPPVALAQAGWGEAFEAFAELLRTRWPRCRDEARAAGAREDIAAFDPATSCAGCPLSVRYEGALGVVTELRRGEASLGLLGVSFPRELAVDEEERSLLREVAGDIAFALHDIELERQRSHYAQIVATSSEAMALVDRDHRYLEVNPSYQRLVGAVGEELAGRALPEVLGRALFEEIIRPRLERCLAGEEVRFEMERQSPALEPRVAEALYTPCRGADGTVTAAAVCIRDVTEQRWTEADRLAESRRAQQYLDVAGVILLALDRDGVVTMINPKGCEVLGYPEEEILGRSWFERFVAPEERESLTVARNLLLDGRVGSTTEESTVVTRSGARRLIAWSNTVVRDPDGRVAGTLGSGEDVSARREAERRIGFLSQVVAQTPDGIVCTDTDFRMTYMNRAAEALFGWTLDELRGETPDVLNADPNAEKIQQEIYRRVASGRVFEGDVLNRRKDGSTFVCQFKVAPILNGKGEVMAYMGAQRDVTEHRKLEAARQQALHESQALLEAARAVLEELDFPSAARAIFGHCAAAIGVSAGYVALLGEAGGENEVLFLEPGGERCTVDPALPMPIRGLRERAYREGRAVYENAFEAGPHRALLPEGHLALDSVLFAPLVLEGTGVGLMGLCNKPGGFDDEDARLAGAFGELAAVALREHRTREELRANEERFRAVFQTVTDGILLADGQGRFVMANQAVCRMLGYTEEELLRLSVGDIHPADEVPRVRRVFEDQRAGRLNLAPDIPMLRRDGSVFFADINSARIVIDGRKLLMGCFRDVTEKRALQASVAQSDRLASMGMLAAGVAHEINNPLTYVLYNLQSLAEDLPGLTRATIQLQRALGPGRAGEILGERAGAVRADRLDDLVARTRDAEQGACRVRDIVKELKTFTRVDEDHTVPVSLNDAIETAVNMAFNEIKYRARLVKDYGELPTLMANDGKLAQVFLNLLVNAAQAIEEGDVEHNEIRVRTWAEGESVMAEVRDTGHGVAGEDLGRLFEPFFTTKKVGVGSGLGLSICHNIVTGLGGTIEVGRQPGRGTRFLVTLPVRKAAEPGEAREPREVQAVGGRLLIVDDEVHVGEAMARMLESDHESVVVTSGQEAMRILEKDRRFDAVISDLMMPDITGMDLHQWLEVRHPRLAERMLFITGGAFTPKAKAFLSRVPNPRLEKPFDLQSLRAWLRQIVSTNRYASPTAGDGGGGDGGRGDGE
jgi:PAS domain S-box-containing protein